MDFEHSEETPYARALVYRTHRDELAAVVPHLDAVRKVELRSRTAHADGRLEQLYRWFGTKAALPLLARPFVPEKLLVWHHRTTWDDDRMHAEWAIEVPGFGEAIECLGTNAYETTAEGCRIRITGRFHFRPERVEEMAGVPASTVPMVERMVVTLVVPLLEQSGAAVARYLEASGAPRGPDQGT